MPIETQAEHGRMAPIAARRWAKPALGGRVLFWMGVGARAWRMAVGAGGRSG